MARVCKNFKQCEKVLIDDQGLIINHPNKVVNENGGAEFLCDECNARVEAKKTEDKKAEPKKEVTEEVEPEEKKEVKKTAKKAAKKGGKKK